MSRWSRRRPCTSPCEPQSAISESFRMPDLPASASGCHSLSSAEQLLNGYPMSTNRSAECLLPRERCRSRQVSGANFGINLRGRQPAGFCIPKRLILGSIFRHDFFYCVDQLHQCCFRCFSRRVKVIPNHVDYWPPLLRNSGSHLIPGKPVAGGET